MKAQPVVAAVCVSLAMLCVPAPGRAQGRLVLPTSIAAGAAAADWASTYYALTRARVHEVNPVLHPFEKRPLTLVLLGGAIDVATVWAWNGSIGRSRPRVAASGLWAMAAFRTYLAVRNAGNARRAPRRRAQWQDAPSSGALPVSAPRATLLPAHPDD